MHASGHVTCALSPTNFLYSSALDAACASTGRETAGKARGLGEGQPSRHREILIQTMTRTADRLARGAESAEGVARARTA